EIKDEQRQRQRRRDGNRDDARFAPAQRQQDQQRDPQHRESHVEKQFVRFFGGGPPVMPRDRNPNVVGNDSAFERLDLLQHLVGDRDGIRAGPFSDAQGHAGLFFGPFRRGRAFAKKDILGWLLGPVFHQRHVAQVNRPVFEY